MALAPTASDKSSTASKVADMVVFHVGKKHIIIIWRRVNVTSADESTPGHMASCCATLTHQQVSH